MLELQCNSNYKMQLKHEAFMSGYKWSSQRLRHSGANSGASGFHTHLGTQFSTEKLNLVHQKLQIWTRCPWQPCTKAGSCVGLSDGIEISIWWNKSILPERNVVVFFFFSFWMDLIFSFAGAVWVACISSRKTLDSRIIPQGKRKKGKSTHVF